MKTFWVTGLIIISLLGKAQNVDWYELVIIPEFKDANFLVVRVDSIGMNCTIKDEPRYCSESEHAHDYRVVELRKKQKKALKKIPFNWSLIQESDLTSTQYSDIEEYPFIMEYDYDLVGIERVGVVGADIYLKLDFLLMDRSSGKILGRSTQNNLEDPFFPMKLMIEELNDFSESN